MTTQASSKKQKSKPQKLSIHDFLVTDVDSWANEDGDLPDAALSAFEYSAANMTTGAYTPPPSKSARAYGQRDDRLPSGPSGTRYDLKPLPNEPPYTAYVGGLHYSSTSKTLEDFFDDVKAVRMVRDRFDNQPKGVAYVEFKNRTGLEKALDMDGRRLDGRALRVDVADPPRTPLRSTNLESSDPGTWRRETPLPAARDRMPPARTGSAHNFRAPGGSRDSPWERRSPSYAGDERDWGALRRQGVQSSAASRLSIDRPVPARGSDGRSPLSRTPVSAGPIGVPASVRGTVARGMSSGPAIESTGDAGKHGPIGVSHPPKAKVNPFGDAKPRDEDAMLKKAEERQKARELERAATAPEFLPRQIIQKPQSAASGASGGTLEVKGKKKEEEATEQDSGAVESEISEKVEGLSLENQDTLETNGLLVKPPGETTASAVPSKPGQAEAAPKPQKYIPPSARSKQAAPH